MTVVFHKMTGSGNDFVVLDGRTTDRGHWTPERIAQICDRRDGVGGDGLVIVTPIGPDHVRMTYFNSDGSRADMCGNAALCTTRLAARLEMADPSGMTLSTDAGTFRSRCVGDGHQAEINLPDVDIPVEAGIPLVAGERALTLGAVGVPHLVAVVDDVTEVDIDNRGRELRYHLGAGRNGANANFVSRTSRSTGTGGGETSDRSISSATGDGETSLEDADWAIRTYERGVEGETLACGTGTVAAALAVAASGADSLPLRFRSGSGRILAVSATITDGRATDIWLCGEGRLVARGVWLD
ncbi:MAG: diaminopimelate epimerase [Gemmatimonadales bacterium]|nr:diaminopimelate epimerase [Gemmatimonadales bacterium]